MQTLSTRPFNSTSLKFRTSKYIGMGKVIMGIVLLISLLDIPVLAQTSVARMWNEVLLEAIRNDYARPTVHARNIFHVSMAMYDGWAAYDPVAKPFLLGNVVGPYTCNFNGVPAPQDLKAAREEAISYAAYRLLTHRFVNSPGGEGSLNRFDSLMQFLGYDISVTSMDYTSGSPADLGNYVANCIREFGILDGSNENLDYTNLVYTPFNGFLVPTESGTQGINDPNRWQPLSFDFFIDQAGFEIPGGIPEFLSPEWGKVIPFALTSNDLTIFNRDGDDFWVYHDPGPPAYLQADGSGTSAEYRWNHSLVAIWSSQLDPADRVMIDISPASIGNIASYPTTLEGLRDFYKLTEGGDLSQGHPINPHTGSPYEPQIVPRADYARVLAEFWADGPDSETPPGHWFTILNYVNDHPLLEKKFRGEGQILDDLEWDIKAYFTLGGAVHDAAVTAWGIKGWYDYIRPISAIRYMAEQGQSTDTTLSNYSPEGLPLKEGFIEVISEGDSLAGDENQHVGKIKLFAWRGPESIPDPEIYVGGVDWILAENWWPYQRPTFVTPPFAGYVSGHSTFSRAAAEVMAMITGDTFFPGGIGEFEAKQNEFLVFEEGPSIDITLQWATYRDASDQTSLSRIWGGIHPPVDDMPGRFIGEKIGIAAFNLALQYFGESATPVIAGKNPSRLQVFPNPVNGKDKFISIQIDDLIVDNLSVTLSDFKGRLILDRNIRLSGKRFQLDIGSLSAGIYLLNVKTGKFMTTEKIVISN